MRRRSPADRSSGGASRADALLARGRAAAVHPPGGHLLLPRERAASGLELDRALRKELFELLATDKQRSGRWRREAQFVGERAKREPVEALLEDYPALTAEDVEFARMFVALGRPPGRPRKRPRLACGGE